MINSEWEKAKQHLEYNFVRTPQKKYYDIQQYITKSGNVVYFDHVDDDEPEGYLDVDGEIIEECISISNIKNKCEAKFICKDRVETRIYTYEI